MRVRRPASTSPAALEKPVTVASPSAALRREQPFFRDAFHTERAPKKQPNLLPLEKLLPRAVGDARTLADALADATDLLLGGAMERDSGRDSTVTRDAPNVNDAGDLDANDPRHVAARAQLEANATLEAARLAKLSPEDRAKYEAVKQSCLDANDPVAALALQKLLLEGKLPGAKDSQGEGTTLDHLAALSDETTPLAEGVDRAQLVTDLVQELATPSAINQGPKGTCAPTTIAVQLAMENPAEYARIVAGLASPDGEVTLKGGATLQREPNTEHDDGSGRSAVQRLMGPPFMEMANGDRNYNNRTDDGRGAWADTLDALYEQVMGRPMEAEVYGTDATPEEQAHAMETIDDVLRAGGEVPTAIEYGTGLHKVLVTGTETIDGVEYVKFTNPWGREERMPRAEFEGRIVDVSYDPRLEQLGELIEHRNGERQSTLSDDVERNRRLVVAA